MSPALGAFKSAWAPVAAYSATITVFEQKGAEVQTTIFKYTFRKPSTVTVDVVGGPNNGVSLLWTGGDTVVAHRGSGLGGIFKKTFSLHDPHVETIRGSSIDELSFARILDHSAVTAGAMSQGPGVTINNIDTDAVTLVASDSATNAGYTREVVEIAKTTHFPMRVLGYEGAALVRKIDFANVALTY